MAEVVDEKRLLARLAAGDRSAFAPLYQQHVRRLYAVALRLTGSYEDAEEAVQDCFLDLARLGPQLAGVENLRAWLLRVVTRRAIDLVRKRRARGQEFQSSLDDENAVLPVDVLASATESPSSLAQGAQLARRVRELVDRLPERQGAAFALRHFHALSIAEVADAMELTDGAVKAHLFHATKKLREWLAAEGFLSSATDERKDQQA